MLSNKHSHKISSIKVFKKVEASITKSLICLSLANTEFLKYYFLLGAKQNKTGMDRFQDCCKA